MKRQTSAVILGLMLLFPSLSYAGIIPNGDAIDPGSGATVIDGGLASTYWNNDNNSNSNWEYLYNPPNGGRQFSWVNLQKEFSSLTPIDIALSVDPSEGTTEYLFVENIYNNSGEDWTDYHVLLGVGIGDDFIPLSSFGSNYSGLDFDTPDADPTPEFMYVNNDLLLDDPLDLTPIFATLIHGDQELTFKDGVFASPNIKDAILAFSFDVPDLVSYPDGYTFTLRQYPTIQSFPQDNVVPEPASLILFASGLFGAIGFRLRKKSSGLIA